MHRNAHKTLPVADIEARLEQLTPELIAARKDAVWARIEHRLGAPGSQKPRSARVRPALMAFAVAAGAAALAAGLYACVSVVNGAGSETRVAGQLVVDGLPVTSAEPGKTLVALSATTIDLADDAHIDMDAGAAIRLETAGERLEVRVLGGNVTVKAPPGGRIVAGPWLAETEQGAVLRVSVTNGRTTLEAMQGELLVRAGEVACVLRAGDGSIEAANDATGLAPGCGARPEAAAAGAGPGANGAEPSIPDVGGPEAGTAGTSDTPPDPAGERQPHWDGGAGSGQPDPTGTGGETGSPPPGAPDGGDGDRSSAPGKPDGAPDPAGTSGVPDLPPPSSGDGPATDPGDPGSGDGPPDHSNAGGNGGGNGPPDHSNAGGNDGGGPPDHSNAGGNDGGNGPPDHSNAGGNEGVGGPPDHPNAGGNGENRTPNNSSGGSDGGDGPPNQSNGDGNGPHDRSDGASEDGGKGAPGQPNAGGNHGGDGLPGLSGAGGEGRPGLITDH